jgi:hypothetical protein
MNDGSMAFGSWRRKEKALNRWNIPKWLVDEVVERDRECVYCGVSFRKSDAPFRERPSWEHIVNDATMISRANIALCCRGCNSSKGSKDLLQWFESTYCKSRGITVETVSEVIKETVKRLMPLAVRPSRDESS